MGLRFAVFKITLQAVRPLFLSLGRVSFNLCTSFCDDSATVLVTGRLYVCPQTVWPPLSLQYGASGKMRPTATYGFRCTVEKTT
jgi:hypothetical protein